MLKSFSIKNFRCFQDFTIKPLGRINLITGVNNVGKTALLEGGFLFAGATNPQLAMSINAFRGIEVFEIKSDLQSETPWNSLFFGFDEDAKITIIGEDEKLGIRSLNMQIQRKESELVMKRVPDKKREGFMLSELTGKSLELEFINESKKSIKSKMTLEDKGIKVNSPSVPIPYPAIFLSAKPKNTNVVDAKRYSEMEKIGKENMVLNVLKHVEPKLRRLAVTLTAGEPMISGDIGIKRLLPLAMMGEGMTRVCSLVLAIANSQNGIAFIDEIENGIHHSIMDKIWIGVFETAKQFNTQIFATTHSRECVIAAHNVFSKSNEDDFLLHRLDKIDGKIEAKTYDRKILEAALKTDLEIR